MISSITTLGAPPATLPRDVTVPGFASHAAASAAVSAAAAVASARVRARVAARIIVLTPNETDLPSTSGCGRVGRGVGASFVVGGRGQRVPDRGIAVTENAGDPVAEPLERIVPQQRSR